LRACRETSSEEDGGDSDDSEEAAAAARKRGGGRRGAKAQPAPADRFAAFALPDTTGMDADSAAAAVVAAQMEAQERARPRRAAAQAAVKTFKKHDSGSDDSAGDDDDEDEEDGDAEDDDQDGDYGAEQQAVPYADGEAESYAEVRPRLRSIIAVLPLSRLSNLPPIAQAASIERVLGVRRLADGSVDYCVKLKERPYREAMWRSGVWMTRFAPTKLRGYRGRAARDGMDDGTVAAVAHDAAAAAAAQGLATDEGEPVEPEPAPAPGDAAAPIYVGADVYYPAAYCQIDRVVASRESAFGGAPKDFLVKWRGLGYASSTWESGATLTSAADGAAVARYEAIMAPHRRAPAEAKLPAEGTLVLPPTFKPGCTLRDYQCVSFDWMVRNMRRKRNVILGDEMGLGASLCRSRCTCACDDLTHNSAPQAKRRRAWLCWSTRAWRARAPSW
jgi:hypothetical protein